MHASSKERIGEDRVIHVVHAFASWEVGTCISSVMRQLSSFMATEVASDHKVQSIRVLIPFHGEFLFCFAATVVQYLQFSE